MSLSASLGASPSLAPAPPASPALPAAGPRRYDRMLGWGAALVLVLGSVLFLAGGRGHPAITVTPGAGAEEFFRAFAEKVRHTHDWHGIHLLILIGPLCWAVAAPALLDALRPDARAVTSAARSALLLSGALWAIAFVFDGFGAPVYAQAIAGATSLEAASGVLTSFAASAVMMSRMGLVSWVLLGLGMAAIGGSLLAPGVRTVWRTAVGASGIVIGAWPLLAALEGEYAGGPFTSRFWFPNALVVALWFAALATCAFRGGRSGQPERLAE